VPGGKGVRKLARSGLIVGWRKNLILAGREEYSPLHELSSWGKDGNAITKVSSWSCVAKCSAESVRSGGGHTAWRIHVPN